MWKLYLFIAFALITIPLSLWAYTSFYIPAKHIFVKNNNQYYTVSYNPTRKFSQLINQWGIFKKGIIIRGKYHVVKNITVELVDNSIEIPREVNTNTINNSGAIYKEGNLSIFISISRIPIPNERDIISNIFIQQLLTQLYVLSHDQITRNHLNTDLQPSINNFISQPAHNPFILNIVQ